MRTLCVPLSFAQVVEHPRECGSLCLPMCLSTWLGRGVFSSRFSKKFNKIGNAVSRLKSMVNLIKYTS